MQRDKVLVKKILGILEASDKVFKEIDFKATGASPEAVTGHLLYMRDAGLVAFGDAVGAPGAGVYPFLVRLTWAGFDWLEKG